MTSLCLLAVPAGAQVSARQELDAALLILRARHINRDKVDWPSLVTQAQNSLEGERAADAYPAIRVVIGALGTRHTVLLRPDAVAARATGQQVGTAMPPPLRLPQDRRIDADIGLVQVPSMADPRVASLNAYTGAARDALAAMAKDGVCRVIVDLRGNSGGNMYPMMLGLMPLLGPEPYGTFIVPEGRPRPWQITEVMRSSGAKVNYDPPPAWQAHLPVAVLIDRRTASSGEFTALALAGRAHTRSFGETSAGFLTANAALPLPDGALLVVTESGAGDRNGVAQAVELELDQPTAPGDATVTAAAQWLRGQPCDMK